ncbi:MAG: ribosome-associated translation inhibitor RaiA [Proteobacteria bacterium]|nr:ribosome-associated translation inhibitor RaiA [Pseudomonadota bacterium]NLN63570.1 ribosome-associated translation inhibitor RaiA [Myxococcales bacterium]
MTFRHMDPSDAMKELVADKVSRLKKFVTGPVEATVVLSMERYLQVCDAMISSNGHVYKVREESEDMYTSIDRAMEKIERQIDKTKGRMRAGRTA